MVKEVWLPIKGFEKYYEVSNLGNIKSLDREVRHRTKLGNERIYIKKGRILSCAGTKYKMVELTSEDRRKRETVHRVVAQNFIPNPTNLPCINHINGNKKDNRVENLEWCTYSHNGLHAFKCGLNKARKGVDSPASKLSTEEISFIFSETKKGRFSKDIATDINISEYHLCKILRGKARVYDIERLGLTPTEPNKPYTKLLKEDTVRLIRKLHSDGESYSNLRNRFGLTDGTLSDIVKRRTYKWVLD